MTSTVTPVANMTDDEVVALNKALVKKLYRKIAVAAAVTTVAVVGVNLVLKRMSNNENDED